MSEVQQQFITTPFEGSESGVLAALNRGRVLAGRVPLTEADWIWRCSNPDGACLGVARDGGGEVQAAVMALGHRVSLDGEQARFLEIVDVFNDFGRARGLARTRAYLELLEAFARRHGGRVPEGVPVMYAVPNRRAHRIGLARLKTEVLRSAELLVGELDALRLEREAGVEVVEASKFADEVDSLFESTSKNRGAFLVRDAQRLNWRYIEHPDRGYRILLARRSTDLVGYLVYRFGVHAGLLGGVLYDWAFPEEDGEVARALLERAVTETRDLGGTQLITSVSSRAREYDSFQFAGFRVHDSGNYTVFRGFQKPYIMSWLFNNWYTTLGDMESD